MKFCHKNNLRLLKLLISSMSSELDESLSGLNILSELKFPQTMRGNLETLSCLTATGADFETIEILHCKKATGKFVLLP